MKRAILAAALCLMTLCVSAQTKSKFKWNVNLGRKTVQVVDTTALEENRRLARQVDSLRCLLDSLRNEAACETAQEDDMLAVSEYTPQQTDSLINLWYKRNQGFDVEEIENFDAEHSERFTSDVTDEVMMQRLADMNPYFALPFNETVRHYMILYSEKMPRSMEHMLGLCRYYMPIFEEALAKYNLPQELKYLSIVESHLIPTATSRVGARGMWQFMY